jgi:hypothetical protein
LIDCYHTSEKKKILRPIPEKESMCMQIILLTPMIIKNECLAQSYVLTYPGTTAPAIPKEAHKPTYPKTTPAIEVPTYVP